MRRLVPLAAVLVLLAACSGGAALAPTAPPSDPSVPAPVASPDPVTTPEAAFARIVALEPRLAGIRPLDDEMIGQSSWYEATETEGGYEVEVYVGWGDCIAGCIDQHTWNFLVATDGRVALVNDEGAPVPPDEWPSPGGTGLTGILGTASAAPTCPVERPGDPNCLPRPVVNAPVVITDAQGEEVTRAFTDTTGRFFVELPAGSYVVVARPVEGLMSFPEPLEVEVSAGEATVELHYDTGIR